MIRHHRTLIIVASIFLLAGAMAGTWAFILRSRVLNAVVPTRRLVESVRQRDVALACTEVAGARVAWDRAATLARPAAPILRHLQWLPRIGTDVAILPEMVELAREGTTAGEKVCALIQPALDTQGGAAQLTVIARQLRAQPELLASVPEHLRRVEQTWKAIAPSAGRSRYLAPYREQLASLDDLLPAAIRAADEIAEAGPHVSWLLGLDAPRRYLVATQNPFELRPTGGFMGIICLVEVDQGRATGSCDNSYDYDAKWPNIDEMPAPYLRYLRLGGWYLRDANWFPDFPTTARTLQEFWKLNQQPDVDGVIAVDLYAFAPLLRATGPLALDDRTAIGGDEFVDYILEAYYDGAEYADKSRVRTLMPRVLNHLLQVDQQSLPGVVRALQTNASERHLQVVLKQDALQAVLSRHGWDGAMHSVDGDSLRIVDAAVNYTDMNTFVERLTHYDVALDATGTPVTATLTLTYTNRYSPWAEAPTPHAVSGACTDPKTLKLEQRIGCYANYLRVYVPKGSHQVDIQGVEESLGGGLEHGRTVFGGYLRLNPGEQRVVRIQYVLPQLTPGSLLVEKQAGSVAPPILFTAHDGWSQSALWASGRADLELTYRTSEHGVVIDGADDQVARTDFDKNQVFLTGLSQWQAGNGEQAITTWQAGDALDHALDHARGLSATSSPEAIALVQAIHAAATSGRSAFELATLLEAQGDTEAATALYQDAAQRSPDNPLAQLSWARRLAMQKQPIPVLDPMTGLSSALRRWRKQIDDLVARGLYAEAMTNEEVLVRQLPGDRQEMLRYADLLVATGQHDQALARYTSLEGEDDLPGLLAQARLAELNDDADTSRALYTLALPMATNDKLVTRIGHGLRDAGDIKGAIQAYRRAMELAPASIWPLLFAGDAARKTDPNSARAWYEQAQRLGPNSGYPDYKLGLLLLDLGEPDTAEILLQDAVTKEPDVGAFREALDRIRSQMQVP